MTIPQPKEPKRVLVADSDEAIRSTLSETLSRVGIEIVEASNGSEALKAVRSGVFHLVILALRLPQLDGLSVLERICEERPEIPVIIVTAYGNVESAVKAIQTGAKHFIEKPFDVDEMRALVVQTLQRDTDDRKQALKVYEHIITRARTALKERRLDGALEHAKTALTVVSDRPEAFNIMGIVHQLRRRVTEAQRLYRSALALDDSYEPARRNLENISGYPKLLGKYETGE